MPFFICPNCKTRSIDHDGREGLFDHAVACQRCGFGFLFELQDDYYPAPTTGLVTCDAGGRVLATGRGVFELTGFRDQDVMGKDVSDAFGLADYAGDRNPIDVAREFGVRRIGEQLTLRSRSGMKKRVVVDLFPGLDSDGGLLLALTPA
jgi:hypothetical protein